MERDARLQSLFYISFRVPSKGALPPGSLHRAPTARDAPPPEPLSTISQSPLPGSPVGPPWKEMPIIRAFFYITLRVLNKGAPHPLLVPFTERPWRERPHFQRPPSTISQRSQ